VSQLEPLVRIILAGLLMTGCVRPFDDFPPGLTPPEVVATGEIAADIETDAPAKPDVTNDPQQPPPDAPEVQPVLDQDKDTIPDDEDNCVDVGNLAQHDFDQDGLGDACDPDDDNDGSLDEDDCAPLNAQIGTEAPELCDGADNDCDGTTDQEPDGDCGEVGVCSAGVPTFCQGENVFSHFQAVPAFCAYDLCDGVDNDCDGETDEDDFGVCCDCIGQGAPIPDWYIVCDPVAADPDDDDDGIPDIDDNCPLTPNTGQQDLDGDEVGDICDPDDDGDDDPDELDCAPTNPAVHHEAAEVCNGQDDDCDEAIDEDLPFVTCGAGICQTTVPSCVDGTEQVCEPLDLASDEVCDNMDNDCNSLVDDGLPAVTCGLGECAVTVPGCSEGGQTPQCVPKPKADEICDGKDNDCNGATDEELGTQSCGSGPCTSVVAACENGAVPTCVPKPSTGQPCEAPPAECTKTTSGTDLCGEPCTKVGPLNCFTVHPACTESNPGAPTDDPKCTTPKGSFGCGLGGNCDAFPNTIGADCGNCEVIHCMQVVGQASVSQFVCNNIPVPPTP